jgi:hypothetical protein
MDPANYQDPQQVKNLVRKALVMTCVLASLALASLNISSSSSSMSLGSGRAGFVSGFGSISPAKAKTTLKGLSQN